MEPLTMAALMAGMGLAKSELIDRPREQRQRRAEAERIKWSPWTGMNYAPQVEEARPFDAAFQGAVAGAQFGKQFGGDNAASAGQDTGSAEGGELSLTGGSAPKPQYNLGVQYEPQKLEGYDQALVPQDQQLMQMYNAGYDPSLIQPWTMMGQRPMPDASVIGQPRLGR